VRHERMNEKNETVIDRMDIDRTKGKKQNLLKRVSWSETAMIHSLDIEICWLTTAMTLMNGVSNASAALRVCWCC